MDQAWLIRFSVCGNTPNPSRISGVHSTPKICVMLSSLQTGLKTQVTMSLIAWYVFDPVNMYHICLLKATSLSWHRIGVLGTSSWKFPNKPGNSRGDGRAQEKAGILQKHRAQQGPLNESQSKTPPSHPMFRQRWHYVWQQEHTEM